MFDSIHSVLDSHWRVTLQYGNRIWTYSFPLSLVTFRWSDAELRARMLLSSSTPELSSLPREAVRCLSVRYERDVYCRERATAWVALNECGAIRDQYTRHLLDLGDTPRDDAWRSELRDVHQSYRARVIGHGRTREEILTDLDGSPVGLDLRLYTSDGVVCWNDVFADIAKAAMSEWRFTPYGVLWIDNG
ncbi:hypothetical protein [Streptomyces olivoreticuli]|uniref:hypothetical protein n=1 Tax=Streptomyces olivoreticuli TaxID=68246 RepID=UPI000E2794A5|nr:hypothetical protein [Streptomyces olivoreticuli]